MSEKIQKNFSINNIELVRTDESDEFFYAKLTPLSTMPNSHKNPISAEVLKHYGGTILGKWVVCDASLGENATHTKNQTIVGIVPKDSKVEYVEENGITSMVVDAVLSKLYAKQVYEMFKYQDQRNVSVEFLAEEDTILPNGDTPIKSFDIKAISILGLNINGSCPNANIKVIKFSQNNAEQYYHNIAQNKSLKEFAEERTEKLSTKTYKLNKTELKDTTWGDVDKTTIRDKIMKAKNRDLLVKSVYALVENGWQDAPSEHLKYPIMQLVGNTFYYNRYAFSSALAYARKENETSVISKIEKLYKKFDLDEETKEEEMSEETKNFSESETNDKEEHIVMEEEKKEDKVEEMAETETETPEEKEMGCGKEMSEDESADKEEEKEDKDEPKEDEKEKKFSLDGYADMGAILTLLEAETEQSVNLAKKVMTEMSAQDIVMSYVAMSKELAELKEFKEELDAKEKDKKFSSIMATVKEDLDPKTFAELQEEGKQLNIEQLSAFENKVKAFAYEATKGAKTQNQEILVFGVPNETSNNSSASVDDIYKKYL